MDENEKIVGHMTVNAYQFGAFFMFVNILQEHIDFKKKFRVVLEHDPEKPAIELSFYQKN